MTRVFILERWKLRQWDGMGEVVKSLSIDFAGAVQLKLDLLSPSNIYTSRTQASWVQKFQSENTYESKEKSKYII